MFKDPFNFSTFLSGTVSSGRWKNFVDTGPGHSTVYPTSMAITEFDPTMIACINFSDPEAFKELEKINSPRLLVRNVAVWTNEGKTKLYRHRNWNLSKSHTSSSLLSDKSNVDDENSVIVNTIDISDLVIGLKGTKLMKMDVEGAEYKILNYWSRNRLINQFSSIYCEFHGRKIKYGRLKHFFLFVRLIVRKQNHIVKEWY